MENITKLTMFKYPSFFSKEAIGQSKDGGIPSHAKTFECINNTYERKLCGDASFSGRY